MSSVKDLQKEISSLNFIILEMNDQNKAIGEEKNKWKFIAETLWTLLSEPQRSIISNSIRKELSEE